jgi:hypothetical protein
MKRRKFLKISLLGAIGLYLNPIKVFSSIPSSPAVAAATGCNYVNSFSAVPELTKKRWAKAIYEAVKAQEYFDTILNSDIITINTTSIRKPLS